MFDLRYVMLIWFFPCINGLAFLCVVVSVYPSRFTKSHADRYHLNKKSSIRDFLSAESVKFFNYRLGNALFCIIPL